MDILRRSFFFGLGAVAVAASAGINLRAVPILWGDGEHDDTDALNAFFRRERVEVAGDVIIDQNVLRGGTFLTTAPVIIGPEFSGGVLEHFTVRGKHAGHIFCVKNVKNLTLESGHIDRLVPASFSYGVFFL